MPTTTATVVKPFPLPHKGHTYTSLPAEFPLSLPQPTARVFSVHLLRECSSLSPRRNTLCACLLASGRHRLVLFLLSYHSEGLLSLHPSSSRCSLGQNISCFPPPPPHRHLPQTMIAVNETFSILSLVPGTEAKYSAHSPCTAQSELHSFL